MKILQITNSSCSNNPLLKIFWQNIENLMATELKLTTFAAFESIKTCGMQVQYRYEVDIKVLWWLMGWADFVAQLSFFMLK
jgi:hypothetical protein